MRGDLHETVNIVLGHRFHDPPRALHMHRVEVEVIGPVVPSQEVVHDIRMPHGLLDGSDIPQIALDEDHSAQIAGDVEMALGVLVAEGDHDDAAGGTRRLTM